MTERPKTILELGCGQGRDTVLFLSSGIEVIGLDYSPTCLTQLKERATSLQLEHLVDLRVHDIRKGIPLPDNSVDGCFSHMFFTMQLKDNELSTISFGATSLITVFMPFLDIAYFISEEFITSIIIAMLAGALYLILGTYTMLKVIKELNSREGRSVEK